MFPKDLPVHTSGFIHNVFRDRVAANLCVAPVMSHFHLGPYGTLDVDILHYITSAPITRALRCKSLANL